MANSQQIPVHSHIGGSNGGVVLEYQGFTQTKTNDNLNTQVTYQATREIIENTISSATQWVIGTVDPTWGRLDSIQSQPGDGPFWKAVLNYNNPLNNGLIITTGNDNKPTKNSLTVRMVSMPIESHKNYKKIWNNYLIGLTNLEEPTDGWFAYVSGMTLEQAATLVNSPAYNGKLKWVKSDSDLPTQPVFVEDPQTPSADPTPVYWQIKATPTKLGVQSYDFPTYQISQSAKHKNRDDAAWSLAVKCGKLRFPGGTGDFGLEARLFDSSHQPSSTPPCYHWLCEGAQLNFDGKYWVASCTYEFSPDDNGWDQEMYDVASSGYGFDNVNPIPMPQINNGGN